jgi:hypothetical protein
MECSQRNISLIICEDAIIAIVAFLAAGRCPASHVWRAALACQHVTLPHTTAYTIYPASASSVLQISKGPSRQKRFAQK